MSGTQVQPHSFADTLRIVVGFACNLAFVFTLFYLGTNRAVAAGSFTFERADLFGILLCMVIAFIVLRFASPRARNALLSRPLLWCYAVLLVVGSLLLSFVEATSIAVIVQSILVGIPEGLMLAAWGRAFANCTMVYSVRSVFIATIVAALVCLVASLFPTEAVLDVLKLLPLVSAFTLYGLAKGEAAATLRGSHDNLEDDLLADPIAARQFRMGDLLATKEQREAGARLSNKIMAGTILFGLAAGVMETFASDPGMMSAPSFLATALLLALFCIAALQLLSSGGFNDEDYPSGSASGNAEGPLDSVYRLAVLVILAGFLVVPVLETFGVTGESIVLAGYLGLTCVLISLFLIMSKITAQDAAAVFAVGFLALYTGEMMGIAIGNVIEFIEPIVHVSYFAIAAAGIAVLAAYLFLFTEQDFHALSVIVSEADNFEDACNFIVEQYGLSKREAEILPLALKGRTGERIASEFFISKSTVDTHLRRIYAKTGTHGRQELIDMGERIVSELSSRG